MLLERWTGIRHRIGIGTASTPTKGSLGVLVTQAQHTLGKFSLGVVCETAQTLRGILSRPSRGPVVLLLGRECSAWGDMRQCPSHAARVVQSVGYRHYLKRIPMLLNYDAQSVVAR